MNAFELFASAVAVAAFFEGLPCFVAPGVVRNSMRRAAELGDGALRVTGLALMGGGLALAWLVLDS